MDYCSTVWGDSFHIKSLVLAHMRVSQTMDVRGRVIRETENRSHILLAKSGCMNLPNRIHFRRAVMVFKSLKGLALKYMTSMSNYVNNRINTSNCLRAYKQTDLQIPTGIHKMVFVNRLCL